MANPEYSVVTEPRDLQRIFSVRAIVFVEEQGCPFDEEFDALDLPGAPAVHILGAIADVAGGSEPVACGRIRLIDPIEDAGPEDCDRTAKLERLAIRQAWRGGGNGHRLVAFMMGIARQHGCTRFILNAQSHLADFYQGHGFRVSGPGFIEAGIDHLPMTWMAGPTQGAAK